MFLRSGKRKRVAKPKPRNVRTGIKRPKKEKTVALEKLKLTGLDDDCLEHVFGYLNATDLTNVAEAHPRVVPSARLAYKRKYATKTVRIYNSGLGLSVQDEKIAATVTVFMEHFGCVLQSFSLDYSFTEDPNDHFWREIERTIFKHCTKTLTVIELKHCRANVMEEIRKPFEKVEDLTIISGTIGQSSIWLSKWFPTINYLEFDSVVIQDPDGINETFHLLEDLCLKRLQIVDGTTETLARSFIQSHRGIKGIVIDFQNATCSPEFMQFLSTTLTRLEYLYMIEVQFSPVETHTNIYFEQLKVFAWGFQSNGRMQSNVSITFDQLKELWLYGVDAADTMWRDFILRNPSLKQLIFESKENISADDLLRFVRNLPELNELVIMARRLLPEELILFLRSWPSSDKLERLTMRAHINDGLKEYHDAIDANFKHGYQTTMEMDEISRKMIITRKTD